MSWDVFFMLVGRWLKTLIPKEEGPFLKVVKFEVGVPKSELNLYLIHINPCFGKKIINEIILWF
jgi:hypothetical protein